MFKTWPHIHVFFHGMLNGAIVFGLLFCEMLSGAIVFGLALYV